MSYAVTEKQTAKVLSEKTKDIYGGVNVKLTMDRTVALDDELIEAFKL